MKIKFISAVLLMTGIASAAQAQKVAEFGDPNLGNSWGGCSFDKTYGTGGGSYGGNWLFDEYEITCPSGVYEVGVYSIQDRPSPHDPTCTFYPGDDSYYVQGSCSNWRVYLQ